jgi:hypothetical protein
MDVADRQAFHILLAKLQHPLPETIARVLLRQVRFYSFGRFLFIGMHYIPRFCVVAACICPPMLPRTRCGSSRRDSEQHPSRCQFQYQVVRFWFVVLDARLEQAKMPSFFEGEGPQQGV